MGSSAQDAEAAMIEHLQERLDCGDGIDVEAEPLIIYAGCRWCDGGTEDGPCDCDPGHEDGAWHLLGWDSRSERRLVAMPPATDYDGWEVDTVE